MRRVVVGVFTLACLFALFLLTAKVASADTNMAQICMDPSRVGQAAQSCIAGPLKWDVPLATDLILTRPAGSSSQWDDTTIWAIARGAPPTVEYRTCPLDLPRPSIHGDVNGTYVGDPCGVTQEWHAVPTGTNVDITCTAPTTNTDGSAIAVTQKPLKFYFWEGMAPGPVYRQVSPAVSGCAYTWPNLEAGKHYFVAIAEDAFGAQSSSSNEAMKSIPMPGQATPAAPTNLTAPASQPLVYTFPNTDDALIKLAVGTAKPGAVCHTDWVVNGYQRINVADVNFTPGVSSTGIATFTTCN